MAIDGPGACGDGAVALASGPAARAVEKAESSRQTAEAKLSALWRKIRSSSATEASPRYADSQKMLAYAQTLDYTSLLNYEEDVQPAGREKVICAAGGAVATVKICWRRHVSEHFTGLFRQADHGIVRFSSVSEPQQPSSWSPAPAVIPMVAMKFFRDGTAPSGNVVLAHRKSGGRNPNILSYSLSNHFTENFHFPFKSVLRTLKKYSDFPTFTGLSAFASISQSGQSEGHPVAPYALVMLPPKELRNRKVGSSGVKSLHQQLGGLKAGDLLYDVYVVPEPRKGTDPSGGEVCTAASLGECPAAPYIWRAGEVRLTSAFVPSLFGDKQLFFQHHLFEADLNLRPDWRLEVDTMLGAPFYEKCVDAGLVWDPAAGNLGLDAGNANSTLIAALVSEAQEEDKPVDEALTVTARRSLAASDMEELTNLYSHQHSETGRRTGSAASLLSQLAAPSEASQCPVTGQQAAPPSRPPGAFAGLVAQCPFLAQMSAPLLCCSAAGPGGSPVVAEDSLVVPEKAYSTDFLAKRGRVAKEAEPLPCEPHVRQEGAVEKSEGCVTVFTQPGCPHCGRVTKMMDSLGWSYVEISLAEFPEKLNDMFVLTNRLTVPQVFFNSKHIGGAADFHRLASGHPDPMRLYAEIKAAGPGPHDDALRRPSAGASPASSPAAESAGQVASNCLGVEEERIVVIGGEPYGFRDLEAELVPCIAVKDRRSGLRTYRRCFIGSDLVDFVAQHFGLESRVEAVQVASQLNKSGFFSRVLKKDAGQEFKDGKTLYRFQCHEVALWKALNSQQPSSECLEVTDQSLTLLRSLVDSLDRILGAHTDADGLVDYVAASIDPDFAELARATCELQRVDLAALQPRARAAFAINLYNMAVKQACCALGIPQTDGQRLAFFDGVRIQLGNGFVYSLNDLESGVLRNNKHAPYHLSRPFRQGDQRLGSCLPVDYRIHFALNCGAKSCPPVRWFTEEQLDEQLQLAAQAWVEEAANVTVDLAQKTLHLSKMCKWYESDFGSNKHEILRCLAAHACGEKAAEMHQLSKTTKFSMKFASYDWSHSALRSRPFEEYCYSCTVLAAPLQIGSSDANK